VSPEPALGPVRFGLPGGSEGGSIALDACEHCGRPWPFGADRCPHCGARPGEHVLAPARSRRPVPLWVRQDDARALLLATGPLVVLAALGVLYGVALGALAGGSDGIGPGALAGLLLPFACFGGQVTVVSEDLQWVSSGFPLVVTGVALLALHAGLLGPVRRRATDRPRAVLLVLKTAALVALLLWVGGQFTDRGSWYALLTGSDTDAVLTGVAEGRAALGGGAVTLLAGGLALRRSGVWAGVPATATGRRVWRSARTGALAALVMTGAAALLGLVLTTVAAPGARERFAVVASAPLTLAGLGTGGTAVLSGGAAATTDVSTGLAGALQTAAVESGAQRPLTFADLSDEATSACDGLFGRQQRQCLVDALDKARADRDTSAFEQPVRDSYRLSAVVLDEHVSLADWRLPHSSNGGRAPWWALLGPLLPLGVLAGTTWRLLGRAAPPTRDWALRLAVALGVGYAVVVALLAWLAPLGIAASGADLSGEGLTVALRPSVGSALGVPLLWGVGVASGAAWLWSARRGLAATARVRRPTGERPGQDDLLVDSQALWGPSCGGCGTPYAPGAAFCSTCGRALTAS
jgi:hypothetical protein